MTLMDLLKRHSWNEIKTDIIEMAPFIKDLTPYERVYYELLRMRPIKTNIGILIEYDGLYYSVFGYDLTDTDDEYLYMLEFQSWLEWVNMIISAETLNLFTEARIISCCLLEMTTYGFSSCEVNKMLRELERTSMSKENILNEID